MAHSKALTGSWCINAEGGIATKKFIRHRDGFIETIGYSSTTFWRYKSFSFPSLPVLAKALAERLNQPNVMLIYGRLKEGRDAKLSWPRRWARTSAEENPLTSDPTHLYVGDADKVPVPDGLDSPERWKDAVLWVKANKTPPALAQARWVVCPSSSTGRKKGLVSFRYFAHLAAPATLAEMKRWALSVKRQGFAVDDVVHQIGQPVYFARPIFENMPDPLEGFGDLVWLTDGDEHAHVDWREFDAEIRQYESQVRHTLNSADGDWLARLELTLGGPESFLTPLKRACRTAVALGVNADAWADAVSPLVDAAASQFDPGTAAEKRSLYCDAELRRMHSIFSKYAATQEAEVLAGLAALGLNRK